MDWEPAEAPAAQAAADAAHAGGGARLEAADAAGGAVAHTPSHGMDAAKRLSDGGGRFGVAAGASLAFLTPTTTPGLRSSLKRRQPGSAPAAVAADEAVRSAQWLPRETVAQCVPLVLTRSLAACAVCSRLRRSARAARRRWARAACRARASTFGARR